MVSYTQGQVGTLLETICGADVRTNFEELSCGPDPSPPSDDERRYEEDEEFYYCSLSLADYIDIDAAEVLSEETHVDAVDEDPPNPKKCSYPNCDMHKILNSNFPQKLWKCKTVFYNNN